MWTYGVANSMGNIETHENVRYITMLLISSSWINTFQLVATSLYRIYLCVRVCNFVWTLVISNEPTFGNIMREGLIFQSGWHSRDLPMIIDWRDWNSWKMYQGAAMRRDEGGRRREEGGVEIQDFLPELHMIIAERGWYFRDLHMILGGRGWNSLKRNKMTYDYS